MQSDWRHQNRAERFAYVGLVAYPNADDTAWEWQVLGRRGYSAAAYQKQMMLGSGITSNVMRTERQQAIAILRHALASLEREERVPLLEADGL